ncbi:hypothetical protein AK812_SmicGene40630 [Symbiodinium microadriaticum]|uniref:Uncharacterized protein n=1 Tax=Symbiodinium microadriaticum TaxID=2951 RepID=A0A1Q9C877_SYMMI|nr:hypothetical protein AK812_SmicGene40630 [Symbiodinium microadriaticum]
MEPTHIPPAASIARRWFKVFIRQLPRGFHVWTPSDAEIFQKVYKFVVVDICPKVDNGMWCPMRPGQRNSFGEMAVLGRLGPELRRIARSNLAAVSTFVDVCLAVVVVGMWKVPFADMH